MTRKIPKSELDQAGVSPEEFEAVVQTHAANLRAHASHMANVAAEDARRPGIVSASLEKHLETGHEGTWVPPPREHVAYPAPVTLAMIDESVRRPDFAPDFEVVDDGPTPEEKLRAAKDALLAKVSAAEADLLNSVLPPPGKRRAAAIREVDVRVADDARAAEIIRANAGPPFDQAEVARRVAAGRPAEDTAFLEQRAQAGRTLDAAARKAAAMHEEIEDLTTIEEAEGWQLKPLA